MAQGILQVNVFQEIVAQPQTDAVVEILDSQTNEVIQQLVTDSVGKTPYVDLAAPPEEDSLNSENTAMPYAVYNLRVTRGGYSPNLISGVQILANTIAIQNVFMLPQENLVRQVEIPDHTLYGEFPPKIPEDEVKPLPPATGGIVLQRPVVPEFIIVHQGPPSAEGQNYTVPFKDYIKNVASCEIYSTWPANSIRANILAILSFTLNRVFTEWYRSRGYDFTVTNSTAYDQAFTYGRNIFAEISEIVDEIFTYFITRPSIAQPLFTQYCDGRRVTCPNWLSQWGSMYLANEGYDYMQILKNYYGYDIYLDQAIQVEGIPISYPNTPLSLGASGNNVRTVQTQLNAISNNYPLIPKVAVDGLYGNETANAVSVFQGIFDLPQTGVVDYATWYELSRIYVAVAGLA